MIKVENLSREYVIYEKESGFLIGKKKKKICALNQLNFTVDAGKNIGILGMNGTGKSTLIKLLCGIIAPTYGFIEVDEKYNPFDKKKDYLRKIALVSGNKTQMNYDLSARDNFHFLGAIYNVHRKAADQKAENLAEQLGCLHLVDRQIRKMSFGERLKMEIIASLLHDPQYIFLDEPTIGLDVRTQDQLRKFIKGYNDGNKIIFITSHNLEDISEVCDNLLFIDHGNLSYYGGLEKFCEDYSMNRQIRIEVSLDCVDNIKQYLSKRTSIYNIKVVDKIIIFEVAKNKLVEEIKIILDQFHEKILSFDMDDTGKSEILKKRILEG